jgi:hypothetical protein
MASRAEPELGTAQPQLVKMYFCPTFFPPPSEIKLFTPCIDMIRCWTMASGSALLLVFLIGLGLALIMSASFFILANLPTITCSLLGLMACSQTSPILPLSCTVSRVFGFTRISGRSVPLILGLAVRNMQGLASLAGRCAHARARFARWPLCARKGSLRSLANVRTQGLTSLAGRCAHARARFALWTSCASLTCHHVHAMDSYARMQMCSGKGLLAVESCTDRRKHSGDGQTQYTHGQTETFWGRTNPGHSRTDRNFLGMDKSRTRTHGRKVTQWTDRRKD